MNNRWSITAVTISPTIQNWLRQPTAVSLLHLFDHAINLIDADGEIISVVQSSIGAGPFAIVVDAERPFPSQISPQNSVYKTATTLTIGQLQIDLRPAKLWNPIPRWALLRQQKNSWLVLLPHLQTAIRQQHHRLTAGSPVHFAQKFYQAIADVQQALAQQNMAELATAVAQLAGLGPGLTPAGDDFLLGLLLGLWATRPEAEVVKLGELVLETAVSRTTQLSATWLKAAAQGEATMAWHRLVDALLAGNGYQLPLNRILDTGATSGIAALLGFMVTVGANSSLEHCP